MLPQRGTVTAPPAPVISGMLKKRGKERLSLWRMRWFSLEKDELLWYETKEKAKVLGRLALTDVFSIEPTQLFDVGMWMANSCYFIIKTKPGAHNRTYYLATEKPEEREAWIAALSSAKRLSESRTQVEEQALTFLKAIAPFVDPQCDRPIPRIFHTFTPSNKKRPPRRVYLFGGLTRENVRLDTLHQLDLGTMSWSQVAARGTAPSARYGHSCACRRKRLFLFGGLTEEAPSADLYIFDMVSNTWSKSRNFGSPPSARSFHTAVTVGGRMFVFGGIGAAGAPLPGMHVYDIERDTWQPPPPPKTSEPPALAYHTAVAKDRHIYVFGGHDGKAALGTLWLFNTDTLSWSKQALLGSPPPARTFHASALLGTLVFVFGGWNHSQSAPAAYDDVTALDTGSGAWHAIQCSGNAPQERYGHASVALAADHMLLFGGCDLRNQFFDLHGLVRLSLATCWQRSFDASIGALCCLCSEPVRGETTRLTSSDKTLHVRCLQQFLRRYCDAKTEVASILHDLSTQMAARKLGEAGTQLAIVSNALASEAHPLSENLQRFILSFHERYSAIGAAKDTADTLAACRAQVKSYTTNLSSLVASFFRLFDSPEAQTLLGGLVHDTVVSRLHGMLMPMYNRVHAEADTALALHLAALKSVPLAQLGVAAPLRLPEGGYDLPLRILNTLPFARSPAQKLDCLVLVSRALHVATRNYYDKHPAPGANAIAMAGDDHVGLFIFLLTRCHVSHLLAEIAYIGDLSADLSSEGDYALVTLQVAVGYIQKQQR